MGFQIPQEIDSKALRDGASLRIAGVEDLVLTKRLRRVVDHPAFQRLRRVRQLGPTHLVYPGAVHSRFEHSLGVYATVGLYLKSLLRNADFARLCGEEELLTVLAAGLLHDLGHYPFAHSLEAVHRKDDAVDTWKHEDLGMQILRGNVDGVTDLSFLRNENGETVGDLLQSDWGINLERLEGLCSGRMSGDAVGESAPPSYMILRSIISSAIDADKMDYLWRDSLHTGVPFGESIDRQRLLAAMTLDDSGSKIALDAKGKVCAEVFIFARYMMFSELYWHHTNRAASAMVEAAVRELLLGGGVSDLHAILENDDDQFLEWLFSQFEVGSAGWRLMWGLVRHRRQLYKRVATYSMVYQEEEKLQAYRRLFYASGREIDDLVLRLSEVLSQRIGVDVEKGMLIIDIPPRDKDALETVEVVYRHAYGRQRYPLHELSRIVSGIQSDFVTVVKKIRVFVHPTLANAIRALADLEELLLGVILK